MERNERNDSIFIFYLYYRNGAILFMTAHTLAWNSPKSLWGDIEKSLCLNVSGGLCKVYFQMVFWKVDLGPPCYIWFFIDMVNLLTSEQISQWNLYIHEMYRRSILKWCLTPKKICCHVFLYSCKKTEYIIKSSIL